jgi:hypothetical protein
MDACFKNNELQSKQEITNVAYTFLKCNQFLKR